MKIDGAIALVTGGAGNIGRPIANLLADCGAKVICADLSDAALASLPPNMHPLRMDVTDKVDIDRAITDICKEYGCVEILVNCAGCIVSAPFLNLLNPASLVLSYERFRQDMLINLDSVFLVTAAVVEKMARTRKRGCIVNISSISARGNEGQTTYAAAKAAVEAMTVTWSKELARIGIRCNAVAPGFIDTPSTRAALSEAQIRHIQGSTPLRRLGRPEEVAEATLALVKNEFINGAVLAVNGGLTF